jgi:hypothetical protein
MIKKLLIIIISTGSLYFYVHADNNESKEKNLIENSLSENSLDEEKLDKDDSGEKDSSEKDLNEDDSDADDLDKDDSSEKDSDEDDSDADDLDKDKLSENSNTICSLTGPQGIQGIQGIQGPAGVTNVAYLSFDSKNSVNTLSWLHMPVPKNIFQPNPAFVSTATGVKLAKGTYFIQVHYNLTSSNYNGKNIIMQICEENKSNVAEDQCIAETSGSLFTVWFLFYSLGTNDLRLYSTIEGQMSGMYIIKLS